MRKLTFASVATADDPRADPLHISTDGVLGASVRRDAPLVTGGAGDAHRDSLVGGQWDRVRIAAREAGIAAINCTQTMKDTRSQMPNEFPVYSTT